jgi:hypothetical protein
MAQPNRGIGERSDATVQPPAQDRVLFSEFLVAARRRAACSLDEIALVTKVPARHLEALERGRVDDLPRGVYRRAIVRTYATAVGLDPALVLERFGQVFGAETAFSEWQAAPPTSRQRPAALASVAAGSAAGPATLVSRRAAALSQDPPRGSEREGGSGRFIAGAAVAAVLLLMGGYLLFVPARSSSSPAASSAEDAAAPARAAAAVRTRGGLTAPIARDPVRRIADTAVTAPSAAAVAPAEPEDAAIPATPVESRLVITSDPAGARVTVDGVGWGVTPITIRHLPPGVKVIRVTKDGYVSEEREVRIGEDGAAAARLTLQPRN